MNCLVDTSALVALVARADQYSERANAFLRTPRLRLITNTVIAAELYSLLRRRFGYGEARDALRNLQSSRSGVQIHHFDAELEKRVWDLIDEFSVCRSATRMPRSWSSAATSTSIPSSASMTTFAQAGLRLVPSA